MISFLGIYKNSSLFSLGLCSHSYDLSPLGTDLEVDILLSTAPRGIPMKRALKKLFGALYMEVRGGFLFILSFQGPYLNYE